MPIIAVVSQDPICSPLSLKEGPQCNSSYDFHCTTFPQCIALVRPALRCGGTAFVIVLKTGL